MFYVQHVAQLEANIDIEKRRQSACLFFIFPLITLIIEETSHISNC